ncbi:uncharacterized protein EAE98_001038 [Botrytis deweyae]|uniref:Uncharacterized protein n=2 Tax=Botrytis TaxID=33196 RepID=A0A4Z1JZL9_9HELO|nr:uncharacterized protein EAE98_001038 [Botrytis deweyae]KAF7938700.1 hypothetical protein EAE98_001038 [Botrytis deweyae]KAF7942014.1 hypothetical protein EAE99_000065 [Botrytis elliptica]TGO77120.1 hypothetical protein BELL_0122g00160 [Botrytis elliptica]
MSDSKRPLLKGPPRPPRSNPLALSYTEPPRLKNEVTRTKNDSIRVVEFNGSAIPQPFLDPSIMQKKAQLERERKLEQEKSTRQQLERNQTEGSSRS